MNNEYVAFKNIFGLNNIAMGTNNSTVAADNDMHIMKDINNTNIIITNNYTNIGTMKIKELIVNNNLECDNLIDVIDITTNSNFTIINDLHANDILINNNITVNNSLTVENNCYVHDISSKYLNNQNNITVLSNVTCNNNIYTSELNSVNISSNSLIGNNLTLFDTTIFSYFNINHNITISNNLTCNNVLNTVDINSNNVSCLSLLDINNEVVTDIMICNEDVNIRGDLLVSNNSILNKLIVDGTLNIELLEFLDNESAKNYGLSVNTLYKTGDIIKIVIPDEPPIITLNGANEVILYINESVVDEGVTIADNYTLNIIGTVHTTKQNNYTVYYNAVDINDNIVQSVSRLFQVYNYPNIIDITYNSIDNNINVTTSGIYNKLTYRLTNSSGIIIPELENGTNSENSNIIQMNSIEPDIEYTISISLKASNDSLLAFEEYTFHK